MIPEVIKLSVDGRAGVRCLATAVSGRRVDVSLDESAAAELDRQGRIEPKARVSIVFLSQSLGDSPEVTGVVRQTRLTAAGAEVSVEIEDWEPLAKFWRESGANPGARPR